MKLDHIERALAARNTPKAPVDMAPYVDVLVNSVLTRNTDQAERERRLQLSLKSAFKNLEAIINAIPATDLSPVLGAVSKTEVSFKALHGAIAKVGHAVDGLAGRPGPERVDLGPVVQQIESVAHRLEALADQIAALPLPEISVNAPASAPVVVAEPRPKKWTATVTKRNQVGRPIEWEFTAE